MNLRYVLSIFLALSVFITSAQSTDELAAALIDRDFERVDEVIDSLPFSETMLRVRILSNLIRRHDTSSDIHLYYDNSFHDSYRARIIEPALDKVDTITMEISRDNMYLSRLTKDERLLLTLWSGDVDRFYKEWKSAEFRRSYASNFILSETQQGARKRPSIVLYYGKYVPIGTKDIFGPNQSFGITICSPIESKWMLELGGKFRLNQNDQTFKYYALNQVNEVDSKESYFVGFIGGRKLYDRKDFMVWSRLGAGVEAVDTGLWERNTKTGPNEPEKIYHNLETIHLTTGLSAMKGINKRYIGVEMGFHYCPYQVDRKLLTPMDTMAASGEVFFRF